MKRDVRRNLVVLTVCLLCTILLGGYVTFVQKPKELVQVQKAEQLMALNKAEVASLLVQASDSKEKADQALRRWRSRYKVMPPEITSTEVVAYLNRLTLQGFKNFDVEFEEVRRNADYSVFTYNVAGRGYYTSLYRFIWDIENNRSFYRIRDLELDHIDLVSKDGETGRDRMQVMVSFSLKVDAYFAGTEGLSAPDSSAASAEGKLPSVPANALPAKKPPVNPFFPLVMEALPPNTYNLIDVEVAKLIAITDGKAVFQDHEGYRQVGVGGEVYLGEIITIDPRNQRVVARLNKGGIFDEVELELQSGERYRQALGPLQLAPTAN